MLILRESHPVTGYTNDALSVHLICPYNLPRSGRGRAQPIPLLLHVDTSCNIHGSKTMVLYRLSPVADFYPQT
jgi:hypothetical protein